MNFLVIGSGAREHIIGEKLSQTGASVYSVIKNLNPGLISFSKDILFVRNYANSQKIILDFSLNNKIDCVVIGPEDPLAQGFSDMFWKKDIPVVGPLKILAQIETSKGFTRDLLTKYNIDASPAYQRFSGINGAKDFINSLYGNYVIKFDGLMGGKGVKVSGEHLENIDDGLNYCQEIISNKGTFVIEEKLIGEEFSLMSFSDGKNLAHMPAIQDHKRAYDGDLGPNTGGMGCYSDTNHSLPFLRDNEILEAQEINERVTQALLDFTGEPYRGILYGGFMVTSEGVKLIEYNARFGDPEAMNLLALLDSDLASICSKIVEGNLDSVKFRNEASVCKYIVPKGYGSNPSNDTTIVIEDSYKKYSNLYYAAVNINSKGTITTTSSRAAAVVSTGQSIEEAEQKCEEGLTHISGKNLFIRHDIGKPDLIRKRIEHMEKLR
ncbi:MAG TPA: phosphoribosylamine--glycine ligase [Candidatus Poseidoniia archaeon]|jgi:phosphoribosylamine--glycine ligase|nr:phosphoribosylamine--glycine ligase [Candidatus Poseidoniia archaeon]|tara:strand:- start:1265 stop:2575 length:1311 start_codon:yes stop_codon:yes gene_type:complete